MTQITVDVEIHVIPMLQLVRMALNAEHALREIDVNRVVPRLNEALSSTGCLTCLGESMAEDVGMVLSLAIQMLQAIE